MDEPQTGTFNRIDGPCPRCRATVWVRLLIPTGEVECEKCLSRWPDLHAYTESVRSGLGEGPYMRVFAAIVGSAAASGLLG